MAKEHEKKTCIFCKLDAVISKLTEEDLKTLKEGRRCQAKVDLITETIGEATRERRQKPTHEEMDLMACDEFILFLTHVAYKNEQGG